MRQASVLLLCLIAATAHGASLRIKSGVHSDLCKWGPQYWCSSEKTASRCGKSRFCQENDWTQDLIRDERCTTTQNLIKSARNMFDSKPVKQMSEQDIALLLAKVCSSEKEQQPRLMCKDIVTDRDVLPKLIKLVLSKLPTMSAAVAVGGCRRQAAKSKMCETECGKIIKTLQSSAGTVYTRDHYMRMFKPLCAKMGMAHQVCEAMAESNYEKFIHGITSAIPSEMCPRTSKCLTESAVFEKPKVTSTEECSICKDVVSEIRAMSRSSEIQNAVRSLMKSGCVYLGEFKDLCDRLADDGLTFVAELIASEMEPEVVCEKLSLCRDPEMNSLATSLKTIEPNENELCELCEYIVTFLDEQLKKNATMDEVKKLLTQVCNELPASLKKACNDLVAKYFPLIEAFLEKGFAPKQACQGVKMCPPSAASVFAKQPIGDGECDVCKLVVTNLAHVLSEKSFKEEVDAALDKVCEILPADKRDACTSIIKTYAPLIIQMISDEMDPTQVCAFLNLCPKSTVMKSSSVSVRKESAGLCALCEFVMQELDGILKENSTQQEIMAALEQVCGILPASLKTDCDTLVKQYAPLLLNLLVSFTPSQVCTELRLCNSTHTAPVIRELTVSVRKERADLCALCEFVMQELDGILKENSTQQDILAALEQVCGFLPTSLKNECDKLVEQYTPLLLNILVSYTPSQACTLLGMCKKTHTATVFKSPYVSVRKENADLCGLCEFVMQELDGILKENSTQQEIKAALDQVCQFLPATLKTECDALVEEYTPMLLNLLLSYTPSQVCTMLGLCSSTHTATVMKSPLVGERKERADLCGLCEFVMQELDGILKENSTQQEIKAALDQVCQFLPATLKTECDSLVEQYTPMLLNLLLSYTPSQVCTMLGLCSSTHTATVMKSPLVGERKERADLCGLCEFVMQELDGILKENSTQQEIKAALDQVCQFLPATLKTECDALVEQYTPMLLNLLLSYTPSQVCTMLGLCSSTHTATVMKSPLVGEGKENADLCGLCEFVMQELDGILKENSTQQEIKAALDQVCQFLPATLKTECDALVEQYTPMLLNLLLSYTPSQVCTMLGLCSSTHTATVRKSPLVGERKERADLCGLCEFVMQELDGILKENSTQQEIKAALDQVCQFLPATLKTECDALVEQYTPMLLNLLLSYTPSQVCTMLGLCSSTHTATVGERKERADLCGLCEFVMQELDGILKENSTQQEIKAALDQVCQFLPATLKTECDALVEQYTPMLLNLLLSYTPSQVCTMLGLCSSTHTGLLMKSPKESADLCALCEFVMQELDGILKENSTQQEILAALEQVCGFLPTSLKNECDTLVEQYTPLLLNILVSYTPSQACTLLGMCKKTHTVDMSKMSFPTERKVKADLCPVCELAIQALDNFLGQNKTEEAIENALDTVCDILPTTVKTECDALVKQYTPTIIQLLLAYSPSDVCKLLGLCPQTLTVDMSKMSFPTERKVKADLCPICELAIQTLDNFLGQNKTEEAIENALDTVCDILPSTVKTECDALVKQYTPTIIQLLLAYSPSDVCKLLGLCPQALTVDMSKMSFPTERKVKADLCPVCELAIQALDNFLGQNKTEEAIENALDTVCDILPSTVKTECDALVKQYTPTIIQLLLAYSPSDVCKLLGLCPQTLTVDMSKMSFPTEGKLKANLCPVCEIVIKELDTFLGQNKTEQAIEEALETVCDILSGALKTECDALIKQYTPTLIQLLLAYSPSDVCKLLGLCPDALTVDMSKMSFPTERKVKADLCPVCELAIQALDNFLGQNKTEEAIENALDTVCDILPSTVKTECDALVKQYTPTIIQLLLAYSPSDVCKLLGLCPQALTVDMSKMSFPTERKLKADLCPICELAIQTLDNFLGQNKTEEAIENALDTVCDILPSTVKTECDALVKQYTPTIIQLLLAYSPSDVCKLLGLCPQTLTVDMSKMSFPTERKVKADLCPICEIVIKELDTFLGQNKTEQAIEEALETVCDILSGALKTECDALIEQYTPTLIQLLLAYSPSDVCKLLGLCPDALTVKMTNERQLKANLCPICEFVIKELDGILGQNKTEEAIVSALDKVCDILPSTVKAECDSLVEQFTPTIIKLVLAYPPSEVCKLLGLCPAARSVVPVESRITKQIKNERGQLCVLCTYVFTTIDQMLDSNATKQDAIAVLDKVCDILPSAIKDECEPFVALYAPYVLDLLVQKFSPSFICQHLGMCTNASAVAAGKALALTRKTAGESDLCSLCEYVLQYVDNILAENSTEAEIESALEYACAIVPASMKDQCDTFIEYYTPKLIEYILQHIQPHDICVSIGFCNAQEHKKTLEVNQNQVSSDNCDICKQVLTYLDSILKDNATQAEIESALSKVCDVLPGSFKADCNKYIKQYFYEIVDLLLDFPPSEICRIINLCPSTKGLQTPQDFMCDLCEKVIQRLETMISSTSSEDEIETALESICALLPSQFKTECDKFVEANIPTIIELLLQEARPRQVCIMLTICKNDQAPTAVKSVSTSNVKGEECVLCTTVMSELKTMLSDKSTQEEVRNALDFVCTRVLPKFMSDECVGLVNTYEPLLIQILTESYTPKEICVLLSMCPASSKSDKQPEIQQISITSGPLCPLCELVAQNLDNLLQENSTQAQIEQALEKVCTLIPSTIRKQCVSLIDLFTPQILNLLVQEMKPDVICKQLQLCNATKIEMKAPSPKSMKMAPIKVKDEACDLCTMVFTELDSLLSDNSTQDEIRNALDFVCTRVLPEFMRDECVKLVNTYEPLVIKYLTQMYSPKDICVLLNMCQPSSHNSGKQSKPQQMILSSGPLCPLCQLVAQNLDNLLLDNATEAQILHALEMVCTVLPSTVQDKCVSFIDLFSHEILGFLIKEMKPDVICDQLKLCNAADVELKVKNTVSSGLECDLCELLINKLKSEVSSKSSEAEIKAALEEVCNLLPEAFKSECDNLVDTYSSLIINLILQDLSAEEICQKLGLCSGTLKDTISSGLECDLCELLINKLKSKVSSKSSEAEIKAALEEVCNFLPEAFKSECDNLVDTYSSLIINLILQDLSAEEICQKLGLCSGTLKDTVSNGLECDLCELLINKLKSKVSSKSSEAEIKAALEEVCNFLPEAFKSECDNLVDTYSSLIINLILQDLSAEEICQKLGLCSGTLKDTVSSGLECDLCELLINKLKSKVSSKSSEAEIKAALEEVCNLLPEAFKSECDNLVDTYSSLIINLILQDLSAEEICQKLGLCSETLKAEIGKQKSDGLTCELCEMVINQLKSMISSQSSEAEIENALKEVCNFLPKSFQSECNNLVQTYTPMIIKLILQNLSAQEICLEIGLCPAAQKGLGGVDCVLCELVMNHLKSKISSHSSKAEIESALKEVCDDLPQTFRGVCDSFVDTYTPKIIELLLAHVSAEQICKELRLCSSNMKIRFDYSSVEGCTLCKFALEEAKGFVQDTPTVMALTEGLEHVCRELPSELKTACVDLAIMFGPDLVIYLADKIAPRQMCQMIKLCPPPKPANVKVAEVREPMSLLFKSEPVLKDKALPSVMPDCSACKFALYEVQTALASSFWQEESPKILNLLCDRIKQWPDVCMYMVKENLPKLISDARGFRFPIEFCQDLKLCEPPKPAITAELSPKKRCNLCNRLVRFLGYSNTKTPLDAHSVCGFLVPEEQKPHCLSLVENYSSLLTGLLKKHQNPVVVCQTVNVCPKWPVSRKRLASKPSVVKMMSLN